MTFEDRCHNKLSTTSLFGKAGREDAVIAEYHDCNATIAALMMRDKICINRVENTV